MTADELRFETEPETEVRFDGSPGRRSVSRSERTNLPDRVEADVPYRDVRVDYRLVSRLDDRDGERAEQTDEAGGEPDEKDPGPS